ncbi:MAG: protoporphyrinogen oxidase [Acidobacteria bacterium]|nr:protoporphyrinogen oxidase [Acidobacteriota bacterium]
MTPVSKDSPSIVIVGGGISGLAAAYFLEKQAEQATVDVSIRLLEGDRRLGGVIRTERCGEFLLEAGPDSFLALKPAAIELCRELNLEGELIGSNDERRKTFVLQGGKLRELPDGLMFVVPTRVWPVFRGDLLSLVGKLRLALAPFLPPIEREAADRTVSEFVSKRFGSEVLERLAEPLLAAVYGAEVDTLSASAVLPQLVAIEEKYGNLWRGVSHARAQMKAHVGSKSGGQPLFMTLRNGLGEMVESLQKTLQRTEVVTGSEVRAIGRDGQRYRVEHTGGSEMASAVIVATPAHVTSKLLQSLDSGLASQLGRIRYHSSVIVALGYERRSFGRELKGFGFVVPRTEAKCLTACTWVSTKFPFRSGPEGVLLRCFLGGSRNRGLLERTDEKIVSDTLRELDEIMQLRATPEFVRVYRWENRMPQYDVGHLSRLEMMASSLRSYPGLCLAGNGYRGIGIPDCIQSGSAAATAVMAHIRKGN